MKKNFAIGLIVLGVLLAFIGSYGLIQSKLFAAKYVSSTTQEDAITSQNTTSAPQQGEPTSQTNLDSWQDKASAKQALIAYVHAVTDNTQPDYIEPSERVAVFDLDGTLYLQDQYSYFDVMALLNWVLVENVRNTSPDQQDLARSIQKACLDGTYSGETSQKVALLTQQVYNGLTQQEFMSYIDRFSTTQANGFSNLLRKDAFYAPMVEVVDFLKAHDFEIYIVSAADRDIVRVLCVQRLGIDPSHIIGTDYAHTADAVGGPVTRASELAFSDERENKVVAIAKEIGKRPVLAFGNSSGDYAMLNYTAKNPDHRALSLVVDHDDTSREYGKEGGSASLQQSAAEYGWQLISVQKEFKTLFGNNVTKDV